MNCCDAPVQLAVVPSQHTADIHTFVCTEEHLDGLLACCSARYKLFHDVTVQQICFEQGLSTQVTYDGKREENDFIFFPLRCSLNRAEINGHSKIDAASRNLAAVI